MGGGAWEEVHGGRCMGGGAGGEVQGRRCMGEGAREEVHGRRCTGGGAWGDKRGIKKQDKQENNSSKIKVIRSHDSMSIKIKFYSNEGPTG